MSLSDYADGDEVLVTFRAKIVKTFAEGVRARITRPNGEQTTGSFWSGWVLDEVVLENAAGIRPVEDPHVSELIRAKMDAVEKIQQDIAKITKDWDGNPESHAAFEQALLKRTESLRVAHWDLRAERRKAEETYKEFYELLGIQPEEES